MSEPLDVKSRMIELGELDRLGLCLEWRKKFGNSPPNYTSMTFMRKALIWDVQKEAFGGMPPYLMRALKRAAGGQRGVENAADKLRPGSLLVREWNGRSYQVEVTIEGFRFDGRDYKSLSAISRKITGTNWSGPRFFGLVARKGKT